MPSRNVRSTAKLWAVSWLAKLLPCHLGQHAKEYQRNMNTEVKSHSFRVAVSTRSGQDELAGSSVSAERLVPDLTSRP